MGGFHQLQLNESEKGREAGGSRVVTSLGEQTMPVTECRRLEDACVTLATQDSGDTQELRAGPTTNWGWDLGHVVTFLCL